MKKAKDIDGLLADAHAKAERLVMILEPIHIMGEVVEAKAERDNARLRLMPFVGFADERERKARVALDRAEAKLMRLRRKLLKVVSCSSEQLEALRKLFCDIGWKTNVIR